MSVKGKEKVAPPSPMRRASTLFERIDFNDLRTKSASELWKGVLESRVNAANGGKGDVRGMIEFYLLSCRDKRSYFMTCFVQLQNRG